MGSTGYAVVIVLLGAWFAWLMSRMAEFLPSGQQTLAMLGLGLLAGVLLPLLLLALWSGLDRLTSRDR
jgi:hypothetical protein